MLTYANKLFRSQTTQNTCTLNSYYSLSRNIQCFNSGNNSNNSRNYTTNSYNDKILINNKDYVQSTSDVLENNNISKIKYKPFIKSNDKPINIKNYSSSVSGSSFFSSDSNVLNTPSLSTTSPNSNIEQQQKLDPPRTIKIKIKSKDPFIELPNNKKIYLQKSKKKKDNTSSTTTTTTTTVSPQININNIPLNNNHNNNNSLVNNNNEQITSSFSQQYQQASQIVDNNISQQEKQQSILESTNPFKTIKEELQTIQSLKDEIFSQEKDIINRQNENYQIKTQSTTSSEAVYEKSNVKEKEEEEEKGEEEDNRPHTLIIDGTPLMYKAFNGSPMLTVNGQPINALHGYTQSLLRFLKDFQPDNVALCFDPRGGSFRRDLYPEYKAQRPPMAEELISQFALIDELSNAIGIPVLKIDRFESDDLIATYSRMASEANHRVTIISDDKDLLQLVSNDNITIYRPKSSQSITESEVEEHFGVPSNLVTTYQSLVGDTSDNIPGVPGIGPKTAISIINSFGHLNDILENIESLPSKYQERIQNLKEQIQLSYQLATLNKYVNVPSLETLKFKPINKLKLIEYLDKFKFQRIKDTLHKLNLPFEGEEVETTIVKSKSTKSKKTKIVNLDQTESAITDELSAESTSIEESDKPKTRRKKKSTEPNETDEALDAVLSEPLDEIYTPMNDQDISELRMPNVTLVNTVEKARQVFNQLQSLSYLYHACDTEVIDLDLKKESPIGHGKIICFSVYCGPEIDFGTGSRLWVDVMGEDGDAILEIFKPYFENESIFKVWHNYAFDRHIFYNHGIDVKGFGGDTLHMARLWDAARNGRGGYSLEGLSKELLDNHKTSIKDLFGKQKINRNGLPGKEIIIPPLEVIQRHPKHVETWIEYSSLDAELTWNLRENLQAKLQNMVWMSDTNMWDFYHNLWRPFGHLLTDMERRGMKVDIEHLQNIEVIATKDIHANTEAFLQWAIKYCPSAKYMNPSSDAQIQQLLFAPTTNIKTKEVLPVDGEFECENTEGFIEEGKKKPKKMRPFFISGLGLPSTSHTASGWPSVDGAALRELAGNPAKGKYGKIVNYFKDRAEDKEKGEQEGIEAAKAIASLLEVGSVGTLLSSFIIPLQKLCDSKHRVHTSVNVNTETGRLSSKRPNLQNQPALEKDRYKIRKAFTCEPGNTLIVADYGQLELRLLAHITNCKSMINAFKIGGDFHSRTAMGMYPHVKEAIDKGEVLLEWDGDGEPPKPLLKDVYGAERRKAKTLNFSIAYGKTAHGLSKDWGVTLKEAQDTLERWYADRPEVLLWQRKTIAIANKHKWTRTLMGRYRMLPDIDNPAKGMKGHSERASINTPLQGGAADIVMKAMLMIEDDKRLKELGYQLIMQIHDELILEGPEEHAKEAREIVMRLMSNPLNTPLLIDLVVDCRYARTWYEAK